jgi:tetratricopeptide (TPR) repeat protein
VAVAPAPDPCAEAPVPADRDAALARVDALLRCGAGSSALAIHAALLQRDPRPRWAHELAALALAEGVAERGRALLAAASGSAARSAARVGLALLDVAAFEASGAEADRERARSSFQAALALAPDDPHALSVALRHYLALAAAAPERLALATQLCLDRLAPDAPVRGDGDPVGAALLAGTCARVALLAQEPGEARRRFALALRLDPGEPGTQLTWAAAELTAGNERRAAELYQATTTAPAARDRYIAWLGLGVARTRLHDRPGAEQAYRAAADTRGLTASAPPEQVPPELQFNLGVLLASFADPTNRAEARGLLQAYAARPDADELRRLRCRQLLLELSD